MGLLLLIETERKFCSVLLRIRLDRSPLVVVHVQ